MDARRLAGDPLGGGGQFAATTQPEGGVTLHQQAAWPMVTWGHDTWTPDPAIAISRTQRLRNRGTFTFANPAPISEAVIDLDPQVQEDARSATSLIERFDERVGQWGTPFASILLRTESASSSQIERLTASSRRIALATLGDERHSNATMIARNVGALRAAIALADSMDSNAILTMHAELGGGDDPENAGKYRREWVWIAGNSPVTADYVATRPQNVEPAIDDLVRFMRRTDVEPLTQAALAHAQFETIHPFTDGNGRTGRALVSAVLRHRGVATRLSVPISSGLLADTDAYFDALTSYREGNPQPIVEQFSAATERAIANAELLREDVAEVRDQILATAERKTANIRALADLCGAEPAFTADMAVQVGIPRPSAYRLCERLTSAGLLHRERAIKGVDAWTVVGLTTALDEFAQRAGRRSLRGR